MLPANNQVVFEASFGKGLGGYYNDDPPSGVYNPATSRLKLLPLHAYYIGIEHRWNNVLSSSLLYSALRVDNLGLQPDGGGEGTNNRLQRSGQFFF